MTRQKGNQHNMKALDRGSAVDAALELNGLHVKGAFLGKLYYP